MHDSVPALLIRPSRRLAGYLLAVHGLAISAASLADIHGGLRGGLIVALVASAAWLAGRPGVTRIRCLEDGSLQRLEDGQWQAVVVSADTVVLTWLVILRFRRPNGKTAGTLPILADSLGREDFRRLRVWLRWRARPDQKDAPRDKVALPAERASTILSP